MLIEPDGSLGGCIWATPRMIARREECGDVLFIDAIANCNDVDFACFLVNLLDAYGKSRTTAYCIATSVSVYIHA